MDWPSNCECFYKYKLNLVDARTFRMANESRRVMPQNSLENS